MANLLDTISMYSAFAAATINAVIIVLILARTSRTLFHMLFLSLRRSLHLERKHLSLKFYWAEVWFYFGIIGSPMLPAFLFHMTNVLLKKKKERLDRWLTSCVVLFLSSLLALYSPFVKAFVDNVYRYLYYLVLLLPFVIVSMVMLVSAPRASTSVERSQIRYLLVAMAIGMPLGVTDLIKIFGSPVPKMSQAGSAIFP
jgi:Na+-transporting NADH:ubiquinone oxidoreductase subunit NqrD